MCGIYARVSGYEPDHREIVSVKHRGPDAFSRLDFSVVGRCVTLAHWRLSIIDPKPSSDQPLTRKTNDSWIVFNGEIYNYRELRNEIGGHFDTNSDTEVLLAAYEKWGTGCLQRLRGMFAFVILDRQKQRVFAARDRFGIKPLYYKRNRDGYEFASEIKQILPSKPSANLRRVKDFLFYGAQDHTDETLFEGIQQLRGGESIEISLDSEIRAEKRTWYSLAGIATFEGTFENAVSSYRDTFFQTVDLHLRSDVPLGFCLSGGMDSSAILATASSLLGNLSETPTAIHCNYSGAKFDESRFARLAAEKSSARMVTVTPDPTDLLADLDKVTFFQDEPVPNASVISGYHVFRSGHESGLKVMLDGQGGDEQMASYPQFFPPYLLGLAWHFRFREMLQEANCFSRDHGWTWKNTLNSAALWYAPRSLLHAFRRAEAAVSIPPWVNKKFYWEGRMPTPPWRMIEDSSMTTRAMSILMLRQLSLPMLLHWEDRNSMASSLESRVPFMDHELVELALSLPDQAKIYRGVTKRVLKASMSGLVPDPIIERRDKMGFATPEEAWLRTQSTSDFQDRICSLPRDLGAIIDADGFRSTWTDFLCGAQYSPVLWRLLALQSWKRVFNVDFDF